MTIFQRLVPLGQSNGWQTRIAALKQSAATWRASAAPLRDSSIEWLSTIRTFTTAQRALTVAGLGPAFLLGCAVHDDARTSMLVPPALATTLEFPAPVKAPVHRPVAPAPQALVNQIDTLTAQFGGVVGVGITSIDDNWALSSNGERKMPQQSVSKLWVAMTVLAARDAGRLTLDDQITINESDFTVFHQPVAALVKDGVGYTASIGEILRRAMTMSDNTCNDKLLRLVGGPEAVRAFIAARGLGEIRFGPGEKLLQAGTAGLEWKPEFSRGNAFALARARLAPAVRLAAFESYVSDPPDGAAPSAIANALARLQRGELLSPSSTAWLITTMQSSHTGKQRLRGAVPPGWQFGHKTGTGQDLGGRTAGYNDVGILVAPDGRAYALAVMIGDTRRPIKERQALMQAIVAAIVAQHG
ncbi:class A beta-lactamase-related serine hydrolase [Sphingomonas sp. LB-2]|uniref:serine hydrolase n=1 Tax=Sphingomonas caeni TaxID=2984949 RepID=UPI00222F2CB7|nr:serine hydrolase [Sphingomonas caeni]MCW3846748.1 class A beta-lactamase-related serine hydrolase [Sphingomonas caeni]